MRIRPLAVGPLQACCYLVAPDQGPDAAVIDPGGDAEALVAHLGQLGLTPTLLLLTHGHIDHVAALPDLARAFPSAEVAIHAADAAMLADPGASLASWIGLPFQPVEPHRTLADGDTLTLGPHTIDVLHTPGHTPGGLSFLIRLDAEPDVVFTGDTLFAGGIGRTDFPGGSHSQLLDSIRQRILALDDDTVAYPGHGEPTTIGEERRTNPFLRP